MVLDNIEQLIEKYENGETSLQEEQQLKNYFTQETVEPNLEVYKSMFTYFSQTRNEHFTKDVPLQPKKTYTLYKWISVAAIAVLMFGLYFSNPITGAEKTYADLSVEEQKDYDNAMLAFNILSSNFKKGTDNMTALTTMSESLNHGQESLSLLSEFDNTTDKIFKYE
jgi:hypothetical protein